MLRINRCMGLQLTIEGEAPRSERWCRAGACTPPGTRLSSAQADRHACPACTPAASSGPASGSRGACSASFHARRASLYAPPQTWGACSPASRASASWSSPRTCCQTLGTWQSCAAGTRRWAGCPAGPLRLPGEAARLGRGRAASRVSMCAGPNALPAASRGPAATPVQCWRDAEWAPTAAATQRCTEPFFDGPGHFGACAEGRAALLLPCRSTSRPWTEAPATAAAGCWPPSKAAWTGCAAGPTGSSQVAARCSICRRRVTLPSPSNSPCQPRCLAPSLGQPPRPLRPFPASTPPLRCPLFPPFLPFIY